MYSDIRIHLHKIFYKFRININKKNVVYSIGFIIPFLFGSRLLFNSDGYYLILVLFLTTLAIYCYPERFFSTVFLKNLFLFIPFFFFALLSSVWSQIPIITFSKSLILGLTILCAIVFTQLNVPTNKSCLWHFIPISLVTIGISLISIIFSNPENSWTGGNGMGFKGYFLHQNALGSLCFFNLIPLLFLLLKQKNNLTDKYKIIYLNSRITNYLIIFSLGLNILLLFLTYNRASILSFFVVVICFLFIVKKKITLVLLISSFLLALPFFLFNKSINHTVKMLIFKNYDVNFSVREKLLIPSYQAAIDNFYLGSGYGISDQKFKKDVFGEDITYKIPFQKSITLFSRDKAYSTLAVIEEIGILGFMTLLFPIVVVLFQNLRKNIYSKFKDKNKYYNRVLIISF